PHTVAKICDKLDQVFGLDPNVEVSLEANPGSSDYAKFTDFAKAGVNRISLGIQALDDQALRTLGRKHDKDEALTAIKAATNAVDRVSIDLIYARPDQSLSAWQSELLEAIALGTDHLSLYQLTIEPGTRFEAMVRRGELTPLADDQQAELFEATNKLLAAQGFAAYEVSNYARKGAECQHNLIYWRYQSYLGIGPGAHGRVTDISNNTHVSSRASSRASTRNHRMPQAWLDKVTASGHALQEWQALDLDEQFTETLLMGLRLQEPLSFQRLALIDHGLSEKLRSTLSDSKTLASFVTAGWLHHDDRGLVLTADGRMRLDAITATLVNEVFS
ncbi:MAG: coproporphyrinogen-III oxidase family protein, partial [Alphaproteobacteria bacterium]